MSTEEITYNRREYDRQRDIAKLCRHCNSCKIIFLKDFQGRTVICEIPMAIVNDSETWMLDEHGLRFRLGPRKIGWKIHQCPAATAKNQSPNG